MDNKMTMTRQHFELIARVLNEQIKSSYTHVNKQIAETEAYAVRQVAYQFAEELGRTNALFNTERFLKACGVEQ